MTFRNSIFILTVFGQFLDQAFKNSKGIFVLLGVLFVAAELCAQADSYVYISSTTDQAKGGISVYRLDGESGKLTLMLVDHTLPQTGYLTISSDQRFLYAIDRDQVHAFKISPQAGRIGYLNKMPLEGRGPCYISVSSDNKFAFISNYGGGEVLSYQIDSDGSIKELSDMVKHVRTSVDTSRQTAPHPHMAIPSPTNNWLFVPDLGADLTYVYEIDGAGKLISTKPRGFSPPGSGPRHFAFHPNNRFGYVLNELVGSVTFFKYSAKSGKLKAKQTISTLQASDTVANKSADIHITPNGQYLYASNRGPNTIAAFEIDQKKGNLVRRGNFLCGGSWPRAFGIDPTGNFLIVANKETHNLSVFKINYMDGSLEQVDHMRVTAPQCVKFATAK